MSDSDSGGRARRRRSRRAKRSPDLPVDDVGVNEEPGEIDPADDYDAPEELPDDDAPRTRKGRKARSASRKGRGKAAPQSSAGRRRSAAPSGGVDPVSKFSASALRRVTVLGDRPTEVVYKLAEQSQRKRGAVVLGTLLALCAVALVTLGGVLLYQLVSGEPIGTDRAETAIVEPPPGHSTLVPEVFQGKEDNENDVFEPIAERPGDAEPLTEKRVFGGTEKLELDDTELTLRDSEVTDTCTSLVWGDHLAETLADSSCTSAASGVYKDPDDEYVAQFTLFDLEDESAASAVNTAIDPTDSSTEPGFLLPQDTSIDGLQKGHSQATTQVMGHYLAVYWVARTDGGDPEEGTAMAEINVVAMNAASAVYKEVRDAGEDED
ncbi:hypothetical protein F4561_001848 [Lipingzhangella halophila]|uniref:Uncharacterized protein n=1 Tax=Lipingzhangella halophila TaxID=1783352 RepID=A0A7W7RG43_9ACTN|nr:hypothetical protein [Lipingzhangella halophila]MBB4931028.1 hypothetical protein [Lipingzhangella halophila]